MPLLIAAGAAWLSAGYSQDGPSAEEVARELANPNTPLASLTFKNQFRFYDGNLPGADDQWNYTMLFQPSFPFALDNGDQLIWRPALPIVIEQPVFNPTNGTFYDVSGLGDFGFDLAYAVTTDSGLLIATGLFTTLPTASASELGGGQWSIGPEFLIGKITDKYVLGFFPNHQWDVAGWTGRQVNLTTAQAFATYLPGGGWNIGSSPIMSYDWVTEQWNIPINLNVGKTVMLNGKPWKLSVEGNYYVSRSSTFGSEWMFGINIIPVIANPLAKFFNN